MEDGLAPIRAILAATLVRWRMLIETLPESLLRRPPATGEWSALECLRHLQYADRAYFSVRTHVFLTGGTIVPIDTGASALGDDGPPAQLIADFEAARQECLAVVSELTDSDLARAADHPEYGTVRLGEMLHEWAAHDLAHTMQAERALMQPFIAASGPWRWTFGDLETRP